MFLRNGVYFRKIVYFSILTILHFNFKSQKDDTITNLNFNKFSSNNNNHYHNEHQNQQSQQFSHSTPTHHLYNPHYNPHSSRSPIGRSSSYGKVLPIVNLNRANSVPGSKFNISLN